MKLALPVTWGCVILLISGVGTMLQARWCPPPHSTITICTETQQRYSLLEHQCYDREVFTEESASVPKAEVVWIANQEEPNERIVWWRIKEKPSA